MYLDRLPGWMRSSVAAGVLALAVAGCGGGGGSSSSSGGGGGGGGGGNPPPTPVAVASITLPADNGIAFVGAAKSIPAVVKGADGSTLTDRTISWTSSNTAIATVGATGAPGAATGVAEGTAVLTATVEGKSATMTVYVRKTPTDLAGYKALFPFVAQSGSFVVASDISQAYSDARLDQLLKSWNFFQGFFPKQPGGWAEMYYTWDSAIVSNQGATACPSATLADLVGRMLRTCYEPGPDINSFLVAPHLESATGAVGIDNATALATLSQSFMDSITAPETYTWPWLWEGLSIAFRSGDFANGPYAMRALTDPERTAFKQAQAAGTLMTLSDLIGLTRVRTPPSGTWSGQQLLAEAQSSVLLNYLFINNQTVVKDLFAAIDAGTVTSSADAFAFVLTGIGKTEAQLETDYKAYGAAL